jgi:hypothetical protein
MAGVVRQVGVAGTDLAEVPQLEAEGLEARAAAALLVVAVAEADPRGAWEARRSASNSFGISHSD